jgi:hypothetical protein
MLQITIPSRTGESRTFDLHALPVGGTFAHNLRGPDLYAELVKVGVPGVLPNDGWQQLALKFAVWRDDGSKRS